MSRDMDRAIVKDSASFGVDFLPTHVIARTKEIDQLRMTLAPLRNKRPMRNIWIHGPPGTGKTCVAKSLLHEVQEEHRIKGAYLNCWGHDTFFSLLDRIIRDFRILGAERVSTVYKLEILEKYLQQKPFLLILDEIDKPSPRERESIIYNLCGIPNVTLICICNSELFYSLLDERVRSRLNASVIGFKPYSSDELREILRQRAERGLRDDSYSEDIFHRIADLANGDARMAVQTLKNAASYAEIYDSDHIKLDHVKSGVSLARDTKKRYTLAKLSEHHQIIFMIIRDHGQIRSGELWKEYLARCKKANLQTAAPRTFLLYIKRLQELRLIVVRRALGIKGNVRVFSVAA